MFSIYIVLSFLLVIPIAVPLRHELFELAIPHRLWDDPDGVRAMLLNLRRHVDLELWEALSDYRYLVSFDVSRNDRALLGDMVDIETRRRLSPYKVPEVEVRLSFPRGLSENSMVRNENSDEWNYAFLVITAIDNVDLSRLIGPINQALFRHGRYHALVETQESYGPGSANSLLLRVKEASHAKTLLRLLKESRSVIRIDQIETPQLLDRFAMSFGVAGDDLGGYAGQGSLSRLPGFTPAKFGSESIITIADSGLDLEHCFFGSRDHTLPEVHKIRLTKHNHRESIDLILNQPQHPKVLAYFSLEFPIGDGTMQFTDFFDNYGGHGTHMAGLAAPGGANPNHDDCAYLLPPNSEKQQHYHKKQHTNNTSFTSGAKILFFDLQNNILPQSNSQKLQVPATLKWILQTSYALGSRIFTNSWGSSEGAEYNSYAFELDRFIHLHDDYIVLFAAGNEGPGNSTLSSPGVFKNGITVGATLNTHHSFLAYAARDDIWSGNLSMLSVKEIEEHQYLYSEAHLADFSSRGPTRSGRIKPDVVFPGEFISSSRGVAPNVRGGRIHSGSILMRGTSPATPAVASVVTIIVDKLKITYNLKRPSAALVKAILIHSARPLTGSSQKLEISPEPHQKETYRIRSPNSTVLTRFDQGFGLPVLRDFLRGEYDFKERIEMAAFQPPKRYCFRKLDSEKTKVTMVYDDVPGEVLVNNLNLRLITHDRLSFDRIYTIANGNNLLRLDNKNNVEQAWVEAHYGDVVEIEIGTDGPLYSLRTDLIQTQFVSLVWSGLAEEFKCPDNCTKTWGLPYQCMNTTISTEIGHHVCSYFGYRPECSWNTSVEGLLCEKEGTYTLWNETSNCPYNFPRRIQRDRDDARALTSVTLSRGVRRIKTALALTLVLLIIASVVTNTYIHRLYRRGGVH